MVCEEYLDVINVVVQDAYYHTHPRRISGEGYLISLASHGGQTSNDEAWRQQVMERAFRRMVDKDKILTSRQSSWELHPEFDAKRFFKLRESANWVQQIYSKDVQKQHRSRIALQSLEQFLNSDLDRISGRQLIKLFGHSAGEEYDSLQSPSNKVIKEEPVRELANLTNVPSMAGTKRKRIYIDENGNEEHTSSESESPSPIPLLTPMSSPPSLQSSRSSFEPNNPPLEITRTMGRSPRHVRSGDTPMERATLEKSEQAAARATQADSRAFEISTQETDGLPKSQKSELERLLAKFPWLNACAQRTRDRFPQDKFDFVASGGTVKIKCHDCHQNLYKAIYSEKSICNFEAHLKTPLHKQNVIARLTGVAPPERQASPVIHKQNSKSQASGVDPVARRAELAAYRRSLPSRLSGQTSFPDQASPAAFRKNVTAALYSTSLQGIPPTVERAHPSGNRSKRREPPSPSPELRSLVVIFPFASSAGRFSAPKSTLNDSTPQLYPVEGYLDSRPVMWESVDRTKRRMLDPNDGQTAGLNGVWKLELVDGRPAIRIRAKGKRKSGGELVVPALLRSTLRLGTEIESLQQEHDEIKLQTRALEEAHRHNARLLLAAEGKHDELADRVEALEELSWTSQQLAPAQTVSEDVSARLALLEKRGETQRKTFTSAHQLQVSTSKEMTLLRTKSNRHDEELEALKASKKREKEWRKYLDKVTKDQKAKIEQLEARLKKEREEKQNLKMATEGRIDALINHHQKLSDAMMKRMSALESLLEKKGARI